MAEEAIKKRMRRAIRAAKKTLRYPPGSCEVILLENHVFHIEVVRKKEIRKIRIVLDKITKTDEQMVRDFELPESCTKEIWCRNVDGRFHVRVLKN